MSELGSVLVIRLSALGDVLFATPAVAALRADPRVRRLAWLVEDRAAALVRRVPGLDEVIVFPRRSPLRWPGHALAMLRRRDDLVLDLQGNAKARAQRLVLRAPRQIGYDVPIAREGGQRGLGERVQPPARARHRVAQHLALVRALGVEVPDPVPRPVLAFDEHALGRARALRAAAGGPLVVLHPGTSAFGRLKRWSPASFAALGDRLASAHDARLLVTGGPGETDLVQAVRGALRTRPLEHPTGSLDDLAGLLAAADLVVASDSLPLHLANALGTPVVGLYGPKDPAVTGPYYDRARVVRSGVACSPCTLRRCSDTICMQRLEVGDVLEAASALLAGTAA